MKAKKSVAEAVLRQFKALPTEARYEEVFRIEETIPYGFILCADVDSETLDLCKDRVGLTPEQMNSSFHKSWHKVRDTSQCQLWLEQIIHYMTTYGFKEMGIYSEDTVFIPNEKLKIPEIKDNIYLTVIKGLTMGEIKTLVVEVLKTGIALKEETTKDYLTILKAAGFEKEELLLVKNREMMILLCDEFDIVPSNPVEFLRYVIYSVTEKTLLIKDRETIEAIQANTSNVPYKLFRKANPEVLATVFNRFKPIFLAFKKDKRLIPYINKISKLSKTLHVPMPEDYLNMVTSSEIDVERLNAELKKANIFRKIRLLYALNIRLQDVGALLYKIRNGKSYIKAMSGLGDKKGLKKAYKTVLASIVGSLDVEGKKIYIPEGINYALPATEKQFTGEFPSGTSVRVDKDMVVGIYWEDFEGNVDLDLSTISVEGKIGWNSVHKSEGRDILFSGDMTNSSQGASELFYIANRIKDPLLLVNNLYSGAKGAPFKMFVGKEKPKNMERNYTINPNNVLLKTDTEMSQKQKVLGIILPMENGGIKFILSESSTGGNVSSYNERTIMTRDYLYEFFTSAISLKKVLRKAGAEFVTQEDADIDLSPEKVSKNDFINLISGA